MSKRPLAPVSPPPIPEWEMRRMAVSDLAPADYNPRKITQRAADGLRASLARFGELGGIVWNERTRRLVGGHQRVKALLALGVADVDVRVVDLPASEEKALNVTLNNPAISGAFDLDVLDVVLDDIRADLPNAFDELHLGDLRPLFSSSTGGDSSAGQPDIGDRDENRGTLDAPAGNPGLTDPDEEPEPQAVAVSRPGDMWMLGNHRLICGSSTDAATVGRVLSGVAPCTLFFDPPWDEQFGTPDGSWSSVLAFTDAQRCGDTVRQFGAPAWVFVWDCQACWYTPNRPLKRVKLALWYGELANYDYDGAHYGEPGEAKTASNSRGTYEYRPDARGKHLADLFAKQLAKMHADGAHSHEKPADWVRCLIGCCGVGDVYDPFCGSGVSIIACEHLGRRCYAVELAPEYVDVAVRRWQAFTGNAATLDGDGRTFDAVAAERLVDETGAHG